MTRSCNNTCKNIVKSNYSGFVPAKSGNRNCMEKEKERAILPHAASQKLIKKQKWRKDFLNTVSIIRIIDAEFKSMIENTEFLRKNVTLSRQISFYTQAPNKTNETPDYVHLQKTLVRCERV